MAITFDDLRRAGIGTNGMNPNVIQVPDLSIRGLPQNAPQPMPQQAPPMPQQMPQQPRRGLLGGLFGPEGRDARARLAIGLEGLTMNPNQGLIGQLQSGIEERKVEAERNRTLEYLSKLNTPAAQQALEYAQATGDVVGALKMAMTPPEKPKVMEINGRLVSVGPDNQVTELYSAQPAADPAKAFTQELDLVKAYRSEPDVQAYTETAGHFGTMSSAYNTMQTDPAAGVQGVGDLAIIYSFMKMLDPGSTVMQGEYASAANTSGVPDQLRNTYNTVIDGAKLNPGQRQAFLTQAGNMLKTRADRLSRVNEVYTGTATRGGVDQGFVIQPPALPSFIPAVVPQSAIDAGVTQDEWDLMTQQERQTFVENPNG